MKLKKHTKEGTFKMRSPNGTIHEVPNSHRKNIEKIMKNGGKVEAYLKKLEDGGMPTQQQGGQEQQMQQIMQMVAQALQQGQNPQQIMQMLVQQGVPQQMAQQVIQQVMQQIQGQQQGPQEEMQEPQQEAPQQEMQEGMDTGNQQAPMMRFGGLPVMGATGIVNSWTNNQTGFSPTPKFQQPKTDALNALSQDSTGSTPNPDVSNNLTAAGYDTDNTQVVNTDFIDMQGQPRLVSAIQQPGVTNTINPPAAIPRATGPLLNKRGKPISNNPGNTTQLTGADPTNKVSPYTFNGRLSNTGIQDLDAAHNDRLYGQYYKKLAGDPNTDPADAKKYNKLGKLENFTSGAHAFRLIGDTVRTGVGAFASEMRAAGDQRDANEHQRLQASVDGEITKSTRGDRSQLGGGTNPGIIGKFGARLPMLQHGGMPTEGSDFGSEDPNVMTERGETISDPTQGPVGPNGQPTGLVVHDTTGDSHEDPSGGNPLKLGSNSVVHSKSLGITVGAFMEYAQQFPNAEFIIKTVAEKYKDPNKEVTYAALAKLFDTKALVKEVTMIAKKLDKEEAKIGNSNGTKIANKTAELNSHTLKLKEQKAKEEMAQNSQATGAEGPIYNLAENLKGAGVYGKQLQKETLDPSQAPTTKFGGKMKHGGILSPNFKKIKQAKYGYNTEAPGIPVFENTGKVPADGTTITGTKDDRGYATVYKVIDGRWVAISRSDGVDLNNQPISNDANKVVNDYYNQRLADDLASEAANNAAASVQNPTVSVNSAPSTQIQPLAFPTGDDLAEAVTNFKNLQWDGDQNDPRVKQIAAGFKKGFNKSPWLGKSYEGLKSLHTTGFDPQKYGKTWKNFVASDYQDFLVDKDANNKDNPYGIVKGLFNYFKTTNQEAIKGLEGKEWEELTDTQKKSFLKDNIGGARTYALQVLTGNPFNTPDPQVEVKEDPKKDAEVQQVQATVNKGPLRNKRIFQEGLNPAQIAGPISDLLARRQAVPYIEDKGASDAMAMNTRQRFTDIQPQLNRITRDVQARTRFAGKDSVAQAQGAQYAANAYEAANQVYGQKYNADNQIENQYNQQQLQLRMQAGTNKAKAQEELATRTATRDWKDYAMRRNAIGEIGNKYEQQVANNRSAALYQDMFDQYGLNPNFTSSFVNGKQLSINPLYNNPLDANKTKDAYNRAYYAKTGRMPDILDDAPETKKFGGKVKKSLPKKMIKSKRVK